MKTCFDCDTELRDYRSLRCNSCAQRGNKNCEGKTNSRVPVGSTYIHNDGYVIVKVADPDVWQREHRVVAGLSPGDGLIAHHENGIKTDNRLENLQVMTRAQHTAHHHQSGDIHHQR